MLWKCRIDGVVHEVHVNFGSDNFSSPTARIGLRCGVEALYTLQMNVPDPENVPTTCIGCVTRRSARLRSRALKSGGSPHARRLR